jgi:hypothetical protein
VAGHVPTCLFRRSIARECHMLFRTVFGALTLVGFVLQRGRIAAR